jgi:hypothetical protein
VIATPHELPAPAVGTIFKGTDVEETHLPVLGPIGEGVLTLFASGPSDAVRLYCDLVRTTTFLHDRWLVDPAFRGAIRHSTIDIMAREWGDWIRPLSGIPVYFWSAKTAGLVLEASRSYPLEAEEAVSLVEASERFARGELVQPPSYLPHGVPRALCVFERPCLAITVYGQVRNLSALMWHVGVSTKRQEIWLGLQGIEWMPVGGGFAAPAFWSEGGTLTKPGTYETEGKDPGGEAAFAVERLAFAKWACAAATFLEQGILVPHEEHVGRRVREEAKAFGYEADCKVVVLRKDISEAQRREGLGGTKSVDWAHRWVVRGHWRNQYFPSRQAHAPLWIHPYIKGPEDRPFDSRPTILSVVR